MRFSDTFWLLLIGCAVVAVVVTPRSGHGGSAARMVAAQADIHGGIRLALEQYRLDTDFFPTNLQDLVQSPTNMAKWHGPYLDRLPVDPWDNPYVYYYPGKHSTNSYDLLSVGPDGKEGTKDDIVSWK